MASPPSLTGIQVENVAFSSTAKPPGSTKTLFLGGAGVRGMEIGGTFVKFTAIGVYLEDISVPSLAVKWTGKSAGELMDSVEFFRDIVTGPFEKFTRVSMIKPLTGKQYAEKVSENCISVWKSLGIYGDEEAKAIQDFIQVFENQIFPPSSSILFTHSHPKSLTISFSNQDGSMPEKGTLIIENKLLSETILESIIGIHGVSPEARLSLSTRLSQLLIGNCDLKTFENGKSETTKVTVEKNETDRHELNIGSVEA